VKSITTERVPILVWGESIDEQALVQARNLANLPFAVRHIALMPDAHVGFGMPIGGVLAAEGQVIPHAVGLDIGCGMRTWKAGVTAEELLPVRDAILHDIQRAVPQGFHWHEASQADRTDLFDEVPDIPVLREQMARAERQLGTLGGGNHFIELQVDASGVVWAMIHSGSRNVGLQTAERYDQIARDENRRRLSGVPLEWGLAHLDIGSEAGAEYLAAMDWCLRFAAENRRLMGEAVQSAISRRFPSAQAGPAIDVHHNYAAVEEHFAQKVVVHRKGAVRALGPVIVPGSMGTASYIGEGLGNPDSFESCSHGAGRAMGRKAAMRALSREHVLKELESSGVRLVTASKRAVAEEAPEAYKDIEDVMRWQRDLVEPRIRLIPIGVVKG
jgi:tRNA-splicing ligase RtcB